MEVAKLSDVKNNLSKYVERVRGGARIRILVRGIAVAELIPVSTTSEDDSSAEWKVDELERRGLLRKPRRQAALELMKPGPKVRGKSVVETLLEERHSSR